MAKGIPKGLGSMNDLLKRADAARQIWEMWRSILQEAFDYAAPQRETFRLWAPGQSKNRHIFDSTAVDGLVTFANRIQGSLMPSWQQWMELSAGTEIPEEERDEVNKKLEDSTDIFFANLNHSNFSTEITPALSDLGVSTGAIQIEEVEFGKLGSTSTFKFSNIPLAELHPEMPASGAIENVWRPQEVEGGHIKTLWPKAILPQQLKESVKKDPQKKVKILNGMLRNNDDGLFWQLIIHKPSKTLLFSQSFNTKRLIVFRWHVTPGEVFGRGPILQKISDIRTANKVKQFILENAAIQMAGMYTGVDDGVFNPHTVRIAPGIVMPVSSNASTNPTLKALDRAGDIGLGGIILEDLQNGIRKALLSEPFGEIDDPIRSATEQLLRKQADLQDRGASFGRLKSELIEPLVRAGVDILKGLGKLPNINVDGKEVTINHSSPLSKAEDLEDFQNSQVWYSNVSTLPPEIAAGSAKLEELPKYWAEKLGVSADLIRTDTERKILADKIKEAATVSLGRPNVEETGSA